MGPRPSLTEAQADALIILTGEGSKLSTRQVAERMRRTPNYAYVCLARLEDVGFIGREGKGKATVWFRGRQK